MAFKLTGQLCASAHGTNARQSMQVELLFLATILRLLREQIAWLPTQEQMLQERAFHFVQGIDRFVSQPELSKQRAQILRLAIDILGELSR
jgi:hypothetical protein